MSKGGLSSIKSGKARPSPELARRIEAATGGEVTAASLLGVVEVAAAAKARPLNDGRWSAPVGAGEGVELTPELLRTFGFEEGDVAIIRATPDGLLVTSQRKHVRRIREALRKLVPEDVSLADELVAERRVEAARE